MSDFSSKCREYLTDTGETVYQLASSSGLDRTSLQRMLTGKRLPSIDFIHQFCDSIRINPSQRLELMELYKIEKIGKEVYYNRKYIQELLRVISSQQTISPSGFQRLPSLPFYRGDFSFDVEKKVFSLFEDILDSGSDEEICTNIPANCRLLVQTFARLYPEYGKLPPVIQILPLHQNPTASPDYNMNLETFLCTILPILSGFLNYQPYYYYTQAGRDVSSYTLFPFFFITKKKLLLLSYDMMTFVFTENPAVVSSYNQEFQRILENSRRFFQQSDSPSQILEIFGSIMHTGITTNFALESHPCLALMSYGPDFVQALFKNRDVDLSSPVYTQLATVLKQPSFAFTEDDTYCNYFTLNGIRKFAETGLLDGPYSYHQTPLPVEERKKAIQHLLNTDLGGEKCRILKPSVLPETVIHLEVLSDYSVFLCFLSEEDTFICVYLKETSIGQALNDYLCSLADDHAAYSKKEAQQILLGLLEQL